MSAAVSTSKPGNSIFGLSCEVLGNGTPIVFLHGLSSTHQEWLPLANDLVIRRYKTYLPDLLGHGTSPWPRDISLYTTKYQIQVILAWLENLMVEAPVNLVGHSFGAFLALCIASQYTGPIGSIVLINPFYRFEQLSKIHSFVFSNPEAFMLLWQGIQRIYTNSPRLKTLNKILENSRLCSPHILHISRDIDTQSIEFGKIKQKTLIIWGNKDKTLNPQSFIPLLEKIPNANSYCLPECGHVPHRQNPQATNKIIMSFLNSP